MHSLAIDWALEMSADVILEAISSLHTPASLSPLDSELTTLLPTSATAHISTTT